MDKSSALTAAPAPKNPPPPPPPVDETEKARLAKNAGILADMQATLTAKAAQLAAEGPAPQSELHTWPDGSQAVGVPPFPAQSPKERAAEVEAADKVQSADRFVPPSMPRTGDVDAARNLGTTEEAFKAKVEQQLASDVMSGKSPNVVNPTTDSAKPELANTSGIEGAEALEGPTPEDLKAIAASIKPEGDFEATDEEKEAAVAQVARETKGPIVTDDKKTSAKK